jgi:hypothetical protein
MKVFVSRGRSVIADGATFHQGELVELSPDEAAHLSKLGFVQSEPPTLYAPAEPNPAAIGVQHRGGPQFRR